MLLEMRLRERSVRRTNDAHIARAANTPRELSLMHLYPIDGIVHPFGKNDLERNGRDMCDGHRRGRVEFPKRRVQR